LRGDDAERRASIEALVAEGPSILPILFYYCRVEGDHYREAVVEVISRVHPQGLVAALVEALEDDKLDPHALWQVCNTIRDLGHEATDGGESLEPAIPALVAILRRGRSPFSKAGDALCGIGHRSIPALIRAVGDVNLDPHTRWELAYAIKGCCLYGGSFALRPNPPDPLREEALRALRAILEEPEPTDEEGIESDLKGSIRQFLAEIEAEPLRLPPGQRDGDGEAGDEDDEDMTPPPGTPEASRTPDFVRVSVSSPRPLQDDL